MQLEEIINIKKIKENLDGFLNREVTIKGKVITYFTLDPTTLLQCYMIKDNSDFILVFTEEDLPVVGLEKEVFGRIRQIPFQEKHLIIIDEIL